jgi:hypothetical protein
MGSSGFTVLSSPATPLSLAAGEDIEFTVAYSPTGTAALETATIRIITNDAAAPVVDVAATGRRGTGKIATAIADGGNFGNTCVGSHTDETLTINNSGDCPVSISNITSSSPDFQAPSVLAYPLVVASGGAIDVDIRFQPSSFGLKFGTITIDSDDPASPHTVSVRGVAPAPRLTLMLADNRSFGNCCVGAFRDELLTLSSGGLCTLTVTDITSSSAEFVVPDVVSYPLTIEAGNSLEVPIRFQPTSFGPKTGTITVSSDDPASPQTIELSGNAPAGKLAVTGSTYFGGVRCGRREFRTIAVCNVGDCDLHVSKVAFKHKKRSWALVHNPFPATLHPGSCLNVVIRYKANQVEPRPCDLLIDSDDPETPVRRVEVLAWTRCCCRKCCEACREHRHCEQRHKDCCEEHFHDCCDEPRDWDERHEHRKEENGSGHPRRHHHHRELHEEDEDEE